MISLRHSLVVILPLLFLACNHSAENKAPADVAAIQSLDNSTELSRETANFASDSVATADNEKEDKQQDPKQPKTTTAPNPDWDKKIIKNATVSIEVKDYKQFNELVHSTIKKWGGYVAQEAQEQSEYKIENTITLKVPVDQFDNAVNDLSPAKEKILTKNITSQDVTGEAVDVRSRMEAKKEVRLRYIDLLKQAKNMEEILRVQNVINDVQVEIEAAAGRVNYLNHASAMSTIQLTFFQVLNEQAEKPTEPNYGTRILTALTNGLQWVGELLVILLNLWPLWTVLALVGVWGYRKLKTQKVKPGN